MLKKAWIYSKVFLPLLLALIFNLLVQTPLAKQELLPIGEPIVQQEALGKQEVLGQQDALSLTDVGITSQQLTQWLETSWRNHEAMASLQETAEQAWEQATITESIDGRVANPNAIDPPDTLKFRDAGARFTEEVGSEKKESNPRLPGKNKDLNSTNIAFLWTDKGELKVLTVMAINHDRQRVGIATFPLFGYHEKSGEENTIGNLYKEKGREGILVTLEEYLEVDIEFYVGVEQEVLVKMSEMLGDINVNGEEISIADAFTQTSTGKRSDDEEVVQAIGDKLKQSGSWLVIPQLAWMMVQEVETNLTSKDVWQLFREFQSEMSSDKLRKNSLAGETYLKEGTKYRRIPEEVWINILDLVTGGGEF